MNNNFPINILVNMTIAKYLDYILKSVVEAESFKDNLYVREIYNDLRVAMDSYDYHKAIRHFCSLASFSMESHNGAWEEPTPLEMREVGIYLRKEFPSEEDIVTEEKMKSFWGIDKTDPKTLNRTSLVGRTPNFNLGSEDNEKPFDRYVAKEGKTLINRIKVIDKTDHHVISVYAYLTLTRGDLRGMVTHTINGQPHNGKTSYINYAQGIDILEGDHDRDTLVKGAADTVVYFSNPEQIYPTVEEAMDYLNGFATLMVNQGKKVYKY